jgi:hypothetical protein
MFFGGDPLGGSRSRQVSRHSISGPVIRIYLPVFDGLQRYPAPQLSREFALGKVFARPFLTA